MPPQPEYVLIRDEARKLLYLAKDEYNKGHYSTVCLITYLAEILLRYSMSLRQGLSIDEYRIGIDVLRKILLQNDKDSAKECLEKASKILDDVNKLFMRSREQECYCWGE